MLRSQHRTRKFQVDPGGWYIGRMLPSYGWLVESHGYYMEWVTSSYWPVSWPWRHTLVDLAEYQGGP